MPRLLKGHNFVTTMTPENLKQMLIKTFCIISNQSNHERERSVCVCVCGGGGGGAKSKSAWAQ